MEPRLSGICGTDMGTITAKSSPALAPYVSFPSVMGHEVVADVIEVGEAVDHCQPGDRVVIDPFISCYVRGLEPCPSCARGFTARCERAAGDESGDQLQAPGMILGFCRELPGAWAERMVVHRSQVFQVPDALSDEVAVLVEPLAVCVHAALKRLPAPGDRVLVLGRRYDRAVHGRRVAPARSRCANCRFGAVRFPKGACAALWAPTLHLSDAMLPYKPPKP